METIRSFEDLDCRKACTDFRRYVRKLIRKFPAEEKFALISQMRRASYTLDEKYISKAEFDEGMIKFEKAVSIINGYINYLIKADKAKNLPQQLTNNP